MQSLKSLSENKSEPKKLHHSSNKRKEQRDGHFENAMSNIPSREKLDKHKIADHSIHTDHDYSLEYHNKPQKEIGQGQFKHKIGKLNLKPQNFQKDSHSKNPDHRGDGKNSHAAYYDKEDHKLFDNSEQSVEDGRYRNNFNDPSSQFELEMRVRKPISSRKHSQQHSKHSNDFINENFD